MWNNSDQDEKVTGFNNSGSYFYSNFRTSKVNSFGHSARKHISDPSFTPGPGAYNRFSDFPSQFRRKWSSSLIIKHIWNKNKQFSTNQSFFGGHFHSIFELVIFIHGDILADQFIHLFVHRGCKLSSGDSSEAENQEKHKDKRRTHSKDDPHGNMRIVSLHEIVAAFGHGS